MNKSKRFYFQVLLWFGIWIVLWIFQGSGLGFIQANGLVFIFQAILLAVLIYYAAPALLFKRKYLYFIGASLIGIIVFTWISSLQFDPLHRPPPGSPPTQLIEAPKGPPQIGPSRFFIHFLMLSLSYILATFLETFLVAKKKEEETIRNKNESLQTELKLLKSQINPHFLFNALNNIYALSAIDSAKTQKSISYLADMLRYVLYECEQPLVSLEKEISYIDNYIRLFTLKSSKSYPITTDFKVLDKNIQIAPMLLIPFVENALKHSEIEKIKDTHIRIAIQASASEIEFEVENTIPDKIFNKDSVGGIGIGNVKKRLAIVYPDRHKLTINTENGIFKVTLRISLHGKD